MTTYDFDKSSLVCDYDDGMRGIMPKTELGTPTPFRLRAKQWGVQDYDALSDPKIWRLHGYTETKRAETA